MLIIKPRLTTFDYTGLIDFGDDADKIVRIEDVHIYDCNSVTHCCSLRGCYFCRYLYTCIEYADNVSDEDRERLDEKITGYSGCDDFYMDASHNDPDVTLDDEAFEDYDYDEAFEEVCDYYRCNWHYG